MTCGGVLIWGKHYYRAFLKKSVKFNIYVESERSLGFPDFWPGQKPRWNWYLTPVVTFSEVRRAQIVKSTLLTSMLWPLWSFKISSDTEEREGCGKQREVTAPIQPLIKLQPWFLSLRWKTCFRHTCSLGFCAFSEGPALGQNTLMMIIIYYLVAKGDWDFRIADLVKNFDGTVI